VVGGNILIGGKSEEGCLGVCFTVLVVLFHSVKEGLITRKTVFYIQTVELKGPLWRFIMAFS